MASSASTVSFSKGPLFRQLLSFALPLMAVNILQYVYQAVDMVVVGQVVGDVGLVSMSNAVNAVFLVNAFVIGLTAGGGVVVARAVGARDVAAQRRAYAATLAVALLASVGIAVAGVLLARPAFMANAVPAAALDGAVAYTTVLCCGAVGPFLMNAAAAFLKAQGDAWTPLVLVGAATFVNVALDLVLVGPAGLGVPGAAVATVVAQGLSALLALALAWRRFPAGRVLGCGVFASGLGDDVRAVLSVGVPSAVQMAVVNLSYALVTGLLNRYGVDVAAAAGVGLQISTIAGLPCWAIGQAITTAAAQCAGAGELARARDVARLGARFNIGVTLGIQALIQLFAPAIAALYGLAPGAQLDIAVLYLRITCSVNGLFYAAMYSFDSFALGAGSPRLVLANSLIDAFAVRFGLAFLLSGALGFGYVGIFVAQAASPVIPALIGGAYLRHWTRSRGVAQEK
ncbi:MATE family efflux transporter [Arabiibacter massiliensis]|uniref:MATE family efflux transporter n=1 Tax=Arabiibacter massiliensis TaxID=1870985 RepID=UPI0009BC408A|nr:MATE family efflux transporter [Arabiibacter massiliensis]